MTPPPDADRSAPRVLALDAGTSSVRAALYDARGRPDPAVPVAQAAYAWRTTPAGAMEADAEELLGACLSAIDAVIAAARADGGRAVAAVGAATLWHSVLGVDAAGRAATPLYGWGDARGAEAAARLRERVDEGAMHRRTGCWAHPLYPAVRLLWLGEARGDSLPPVAAWVSPGEHLALRLFGERRCSASMASGTGLLDVRSLRWDAEVLAAVGVSADALSPVSDEPHRGLLPDFARRWPELAEVPWYPALGDGACASLGSGAYGPGVAGLTVGTSAAVRVLREDPAPLVPDDLWCYRLDARRAVWGRALSNGGVVFAWLRRTLALPPAAELEAALGALPPAAHGLTVDPALLPPRPPGGDPGRRAMMAGMTMATTPVEVARAWLEAVAYGIAGAVEAVERALGPVERVVAGGGALTASRAFTRIVADVLGRTVLLSPEPEATLRGAALVALERLGWTRDLAAAEGEAFEPDAANHAIYTEARARKSGTEC